MVEKVRLEKAIKHMKDRLRYCVSDTSIKKEVVEISINGLLELQSLKEPKPIEEWHEDMGDCLWWKFPIEEPPYCGTPLDGDFLEEYYTHFTILPVPNEIK